MNTTLAIEKRNLSAMQYAALSYRIRQITDAAKSGEDVITLTTYSIDEMLPNLQLPSPAEQASHILKYFGDSIQNSGEPARNPPKSFVAQIGAINRPAALRIVRQLADGGLLLIANRSFQGTADEPDGIDLSLKGWAQWEEERRGQFAGSHGFIALQFGDPELDPFLKDVVKPAVSELGYRLEDMRDAARAGVIDNVMRARIRDAAFVLVDLTHANAGAYWEAGYAEGLGKPVLYLCKDSVFAERGTHFDTNHCTTVMWNAKTPAEFSAELQATLRRSLGLFA
ncbi:nucleoside 2-deoxyribosyltransferase [Sphingomonas donggukensis]|uniref:Nucleoside 2-deoxyribosyltransferase n=1 Tax=Sphingomonas donggukensis TaxID=2949093 RepID=A0ABY4TSQ3_9SPHN|nr:nucleoside 2-deoxyribosyltransferase [Sphingomonas donggukensis]URW75437.1 nucleoside 2-deoxyribosyltransferase [Sphingomonas donggukensis]